MPRRPIELRQLSLCDKLQKMTAEQCFRTIISAGWITICISEGQGADGLGASALSESVYIDALPAGRLAFCQDLLDCEKRFFFFFYFSLLVDSAADTQRLVHGRNCRNKADSGEA